MAAEAKSAEEQKVALGFPENATYENYISGNVSPEVASMSTGEKIDHLAKLKQQNERVIKQFTSLAEQVEAITLKAREKKQEKHHPSRYHPEGELQTFDSSLAQIVDKMHYYQKEIAIMRKQLAGSYNNELIIKMEDEIKSKALKLQDLYDENNSLKVWKQEDEQEYAALNREGDYDQKLAELKDETRETRREWREANRRKIEEQKRLIN